MKHFLSLILGMIVEGMMIISYDISYQLSLSNHDAADVARTETALFNVGLHDSYAIYCALDIFN